VKKLRAIGVGSVFRMSVVIGAVLGLVMGFILMIIDFTDKRFLEGVVTLFLAPILYGLLVAIGNTLMAWVYNLAAARLGGIEIYLED
jgi:ABC-type sulfate transport system permease component